MPAFAFLARRTLIRQSVARGRGNEVSDLQAGQFLGAQAGEAANSVSSSYTGYRVPTLPRRRRPARRLAGGAAELRRFALLAEKSTPSTGFDAIAL